VKRTNTLREKATVTKLLILREFHCAPRSTLRPIAEALDVTVQAVSNYVRDLAREGLLELSGDRYVLTPAGIAFLQQGFQDLRREVDEALHDVNIIRVASALAGAPIRGGDPVGLFMEDGDLVARPRAASGSRGRALADASPGEEVAVTDLDGVVDLKPGTIWMLKVPSAHEGGSRAVDVAALPRFLEARGVRFDRVGAYGTSAKLLARRANLPLHLEFTAARAAHTAAAVGLDVLLLVTRDLLPEALRDVDGANEATLSPVRYELLEPPLLEARP